MADKVEIEIPGIGLIEAKNAATEATLLEILKVMQGTQKAIQQQAKGKSGSNSGGGGGPTKADAGNMAAFNKEQQSAGKSFSVLGAAARGVGMAFTGAGKAAGIAVGGFNRMAAGAGMAAGATVTFGQKALAAGESMTNLIESLANVGDSTTQAANALRVIPGVGGVLAGVLGTVAGQIEKSVASYQAAASVGATFSGSVNDMSRAASGAGMTLDQFAGLIKNNSESMMLLGGTTEAGAKQFASLAKDIQGSGVGSELQRLGYTTEQINGGMAKYINILGKTGALQGMSQQQLVASSGAYLKELDALAKITGVSREEKEKEQAALMADAKVRAAMAGLDADQQKQMMAYITSFPKEQQAAIADMIATGNTTTEEAIQLQSMLPGVAQRTMEFGRTLQAGGKINQDALNQAKNSAIIEAQESVKRNKMRGLYDEQAGRTFVGMANLASQKVDGYSQAIGEQGKAAEKANLAESLTKAKQRLSEFSNNFQMALANSGMLDTLMNVFQTLGNFVLSVIVPVFKLFADGLNTVIPMVTAFLVPAFQMLGDFVNNKIVPVFQILGAWIGDGLMPIFTSLWETVGTVVSSFTGLVGGVMGTVDVIEDIFEPALYAISDFIEDNLAPALATLAVVAIPPLIARMATMAMSMLSTIGNFIALNLPMIGFTIAVGALMFAFKKFGVDLGVVTDALKWAGSWISTLFLKLQYGIYSLLNKIPGMRGDFDSDLKSISEKMEENEKDRAKLEEDMAARRTKNLEDAAKKENSRADRDEKRAERRGKREEDAIERKKKAELDAVGAKEKREKDAEDAKKEPTVDMSNPIQMLKTFAAQQKSAFTQEAKALDDKEKARSEMKMANDGYAKALEARNKAEQSGTAEEKKAAEAALADAEKRQKAAQEGQTKADEEVNKAIARMKLAKEGKDPGASAPGVAKEEKKAEAAKPESSAKASGGAVPPINQDIQKNLEMVKAAMEKRGMNDPKYINATLANVMKETGGKVVEENLNYGKTSNERIRSIFGSRAAGKTDAELNAIKGDPKQMGEMMYGSTTKMGQAMGNTEPGDGFKYRGRGNIGLTGKSNYAAASKAIYGDNRLVDNPDLVNDPAVAAEVTAWYMEKGQGRMAKQLGIDTKNMTQAQANQLATSQVAGRAIKRGEGGYIEGELLGKVDKYSADAKIAGIAGAPASSVASTGTPKPVPTGATTADASKARADAAANDPRRTDKPATDTTKPTATATTATATTPAAGEVQAPQFAMQTLIKDGILPTTIAFQDLVKKGIMPMLTGTQVKSLEESKKGIVKPEDSLNKGEEIVSSLKASQDAVKAAGEKMATAKTDAEMKIAKEEMALAKEGLKKSAEVSGWKQEAEVARLNDESKSSIGKAVNPETGELYTPVDLKSQLAGPKMRGTYDNLAASETPKMELIAQKEKEAQEKIELEKQQAANREQLRKEEIMAMNGPAGQNNPGGESIDLNTALRELIAINKRTAELNEKQLSVQSSLSGDLFA